MSESGERRVKRSRRNTPVEIMPEAKPPLACTTPETHSWSEWHRSYRPGVEVRSCTRGNCAAVEYR